MQLLISLDASHFVIDTRQSCNVTKTVHLLDLIYVHCLFNHISGFSVEEEEDVEESMKRCWLQLLRWHLLPVWVLLPWLSKRSCRLLTVSNVTVSNLLKSLQMAPRTKLKSIARPVTKAIVRASQTISPSAVTVMKAAPITKLTTALAVTTRTSR